MLAAGNFSLYGSPIFILKLKNLHLKNISLVTLDTLFLKPANVGSIVINNKRKIL
jgi:hypothetical protein